MPQAHSRGDAVLDVLDVLDVARDGSRTGPTIGANCGSARALTRIPVPPSTTINPRGVSARR